MTTFPISLPPTTAGIQKLVISPSFDAISDTAQRAVVMLLCRNDESLMLNGEPLWEVLPKCNLAGAEVLVTELGEIASNIKDYLNGYDSDEDVDDEDSANYPVVESVDFYFTRIGDLGELGIDIKLEDREELVGVFAYV